MVIPFSLVGKLGTRVERGWGSRPVAAESCQIERRRADGSTAACGAAFGGVGLGRRVSLRSRLEIRALLGQLQPLRCGRRQRPTFARKP